MLFWKFQNHISKLFSFIAGNFVNQDKEDNKESQNKNKTQLKKDAEVSGSGEASTRVSENEIIVEFQGDRYAVNLDKLVTVPANENLREFVDTHYKDFLFHAFNRYKEFVQDDRDYVALILYGRQIIGADKKRVYNGLKECYNFFVEHENYEEAAEAKELIEEMEDGVE